MNAIQNITSADVLALAVRCYKDSSFDSLGFTDKQQEALLSLTLDNLIQEVGYGGAAGGGKSFVGTSWLYLSSLSYPGTNWFIGRFKKSQIFESIVETTIPKVCTKFSIDSRLFKVNSQKGFVKFSNGSNINFLELAYKPGEDRDYDRLGSTEYTGGWIEEGGQVPVKAYEVIRQRIGRHLNDKYNLPGKLLITCNPTKNWIYKLFYKAQKSGSIEDYRLFIQALVDENQYIESGYIDRLDKLTGSERQRKRLGQWEYDADPEALILYDAILDSFHNDHVAADENARYITADIATQGSDEFKVGVWYGFVLVDRLTMAKSGGKEIVDAINGLRIKHRVRPNNVVYDSDGVGSFIGGSGGFIVGANPFVNGSRCLPYRGKDENYENLKTQCAYHAAKRFNDGGYWLRAISEPEDVEKVTEELEQIKRRDMDKDGKLKIINKDEVKQNIGRSPDDSDMIIMREFFELDRKQLPAMA